MDTQEPVPPVGMRSSRVAGAGMWGAARSARWAGPAAGRLAERHSRQALPGRERRGGLGWPAAVAAPGQGAERGAALLAGLPWSRLSGTRAVVWLVALFLIGELVQALSGVRLGAWRELWVVGTAGLAAAGAVVVAAGSSGRAAAVWRAFAVGCILWTAGAFIRALPLDPWRLGPFFAGPARSASDPLLLADVGFLGLAPCFLAGVALALPAGTTTLPRVRLLIDAVVLPAALALLAYLVLGRGGASQTPTDHHILIALVYPAAYISVAFGAILGARRGDQEAGGSRQPLVVGRLEAATLAFVPGAALLAWTSLEPQGLPRSLADACFLAGFALLTLEVLERLGLVVGARATSPAGRNARGAAAPPRTPDQPPWRSLVVGSGEAAARLAPPRGGRLELTARLPALFGSAWNLSLAGAEFRRPQAGAGQRAGAGRPRLPHRQDRAHGPRPARPARRRLPDRGDRLAGAAGGAAGAGPAPPRRAGVQLARAGEVRPRRPGQGRAAGGAGGGGDGERQAVRRAGAAARRGGGAVRAEPGDPARAHADRRRLRPPGDPPPPARLRPRRGVLHGERRAPAGAGRGGRGRGAGPA